MTAATDPDTAAAAVRRATAYLAERGVESPRASAEALVMAALGTDRAGIYARRGPVPADRAAWLDEAIRRRGEGVPLQHLTGQTTFLGLSLVVRPGVFVPRPETEVVALAAIDVIPRRPGAIVVDVGTGAGAIALAVKAARPAAEVWATDVSEAATTLARENATRLGLDVRVAMGDVLEPVPASLRGGIDLLVSNPPYLRAEDHPSLPPEVRADPYQALVGGTQLHRRLAQEAPRWLRPGGWLVLEIGDDQADGVASLLAAAGLTDVTVGADLTGRARLVRGRSPDGDP